LPAFWDWDLSLRFCVQTIKAEQDPVEAISLEQSYFKNTGLSDSNDGIDCTAYRYELVGNFEEGAVDSQLKITGRYLGDNYPKEITENTISDESWWGVHNENDIVRIFPAAGNYNSSSPFKLKGEEGFYWSSTRNESLSGNAWHMHFNSRGVNIKDESTTYKLTVRCVKE
jgi:hypothetical protein